MRNPHNLRVWHLALDLATRIIRAFPRSAESRAPGLRAQVTDAANSVTDNISEGCGRSSNAEFVHFLDFSIGSLNEVESQLAQARKIGVLDDPSYAQLRRRAILLSRMLHPLRRSALHAVALQMNAKKRGRAVRRGSRRKRRKA